MQHRIVISDSDRSVLTEHAKDKSPNEACAILLGRGDTVSKVFLTRNAEESPARFTVSNEDLIEAYRTAEEKKLQVVGVFHSHPNSDAYPSETDKEFMLINAVAWVIYSGTSKDLRAYVLESDIREIPIE